VNEGHTEVLGVALACLLVFTIWILSNLALAGEANALGVATMTVSAISTAALLAIERGNSDIVILAMVVAAATCQSRRRHVVSALLAGSAAALKVFPLGAVIIFMRPGRSRQRALSIWGVTVLVGALFVVPELPTIIQRTPTSIYNSFGAQLLPAAVTEVAFRQLPAAVVQLVSILIFALVIVSWIVFLRRFDENYISEAIAPLAREALSSALFLAGSGCVILAYLAGNSFDYRLLFLLLPIAGLIRSRSDVGRGLALLVSMVLATPALTAMAWPPITRLLAPDLAVATVIVGGFVQDVMLSIVLPLLALIAWKLLRIPADADGAE
jgi:hypothetical protein